MPHKHIYIIPLPSKPKPIEAATEEERIALFAQQVAEQKRLAQLERELDLDSITDCKRVSKIGIDAYYSENPHENK